MGNPQPSPPSISLSVADGDRKPNSCFHYGESAASALFVGSASPVGSFNDSLHPEHTLFSPSSSALLEPAGAPPDVFNLSGDLLVEPEHHSYHHDPHHAGHDPTQLSSSLLSSHSAPSASGRRVRSGSLFSTNSIWNDDAIPANSPSHGSANSAVIDLFQEVSSPNALPVNSASSFLNPLNLSQPSHSTLSSQPRNRSHTTSGSLNAFGSQNLDSSRLGSSHFIHTPPSDVAPLAESLYLNPHDFPVNGTRNRSQTYSGVGPKISYSGSGQTPPYHSQSAQGNSTVQPTNFSYPSSSLIQDPNLPFIGSHAMPFLQDNFDFYNLSFTTNFEDPSLGPTNTLLLDNVPQFLDASKLYQLLSNPTGLLAGYHNRGILSVRVSQASTSKMALVVCPSVEVAMNLKANFNHLEIVQGVILYVAFAKVTEKDRSLYSTGSNIAKLSSSSLTSQNIAATFTPADVSKKSSDASLNSATIKRSSPVSSLGAEYIASSILANAKTLSCSLYLDTNKIRSILNKASEFKNGSYSKEVGPLPETVPIRQFDSSKLREIRKSLEVNEKLAEGNQASITENDLDAIPMTQLEIEELAICMLDELPELCYDHIGNTVVQKLFSVVESSVVKFMMLKTIVPYIAQLGMHKNGTWAIQKIINVCKDNARQKELISNSLRPYTVKLFNDQFGNYVLQCCLKFGSPYNDFIFEALCNHFVEISSGRFGVRCIRTISELATDMQQKDGTVTREQLFLIAGLIVEYAPEIVMNNNGSLSIAWFLDSFHRCKSTSYDNSYIVLCERLLPALDKFCSHKLANQTILKVMSNRSETLAKQRIMDTIFHTFNENDNEQSVRPSKTLENILREDNENSAGPLFIYKVITNPALVSIGTDQYNRKYQRFIVGQIKWVLSEMNIQNTSPYKKLLEEVGLYANKPNRSGSDSRKGKRGSANTASGNLKSNKPHAPNSQPISGAMLQNNAPHIHVSSNYGQFPPFANGDYFGYGSSAIANNNQGSTAMNAIDIGYMQQRSYMGGSDTSLPQSKSFHQDSVMRHLEQLSLSSAAMGYVSNPGTPHD